VERTLDLTQLRRSDDASGEVVVDVTGRWPGDFYFIAPLVRAHTTATRVHFVGFHPQEENYYYTKAVLRAALANPRLESIQFSGGNWTVSFSLLKYRPEHGAAGEVDSKLLEKLLQASRVGAQQESKCG
jgi:hypothetical protein